MMLPSKLFWQLDSLHLSFLVDSSAGGCFIDQEVVKQANIPLQELPDPKCISGRNFAEVHRTTNHTSYLDYFWKPL